MHRRTFGKMLTAALVSKRVGSLRGQETGSGSNLLPSVDSVEIDPRPKEPLTIGANKQLFVDRYIVDHCDEILFTLMPPQKHAANPLFIADVPSDGQQIIPTLVRWNQEKKLFQLWYYSIHFGAKKEQHFPSYAESSDGIQWRRPNLGVREFNGSTANNMVQGDAAMMIYDDHTTDPGRRYIAVDTVKGPDVAIWFSGDGIHWTPSARNPVLSPTGDTHSLLGWDEHYKKYIGYIRPPGSPGTGHGQRRQIGISFSDDAENWTPPVPVIVADEHDPLGTEFYWLHATRYESAYIGILSVLHLDASALDLHEPDPAGQQQTVDMQLVCSRDAIHWNRMGNRAPCVPLGPYQSWDDQVLWPAVPILVGDEIRIYYGGTSQRHNLRDLQGTLGIKIEGRTRVGGIGLATLRRDGWVAAQPNLHRRGVLTTRTFILESQHLELNADASKGKILVELLSAEGTPLGGFSGADAATVSSDSVRHRVMWKRPITEFKGQSVRLRFTLENSELYAFQFPE